MELSLIFGPLAAVEKAKPQFCHDDERYVDVPGGAEALSSRGISTFQVGIAICVKGNLQSYPAAGDSLPVFGVNDVVLRDRVENLLLKPAPAPYEPVQVVMAARFALQPKPSPNRLERGFIEALAFGASFGAKHLVNPPGDVTERVLHACIVFIGCRHDKPYRWREY